MIKLKPFFSQFRYHWRTNTPFVISFSATAACVVAVAVAAPIVAGGAKIPMAALAVLLVLASVGGIATVIGLVRGIRQRERRSRGLDEAPKGFLIDLLLPPGRAEDALVNILGRYDYWVAKHGIRKAHAIFMTQSIVVVVTYWIDWVLRRLKLFSLFRRS